MEIVSDIAYMKKPSWGWRTVLRRTTSSTAGAASSQRRVSAERDNVKSCLLLLAAQFDGRILLSLGEVCDAIGIQKQTAYNRLSSGRFPIPMRKEGRNLVGDIRDVADYLDEQRAVARADYQRRKLALATT